MQISSTASISAMQANNVEFAVSAHNLANIDTPGFQTQELSRVESASGGVSVELSRSEGGQVSIVDEQVRQRRLVLNNKAQMKAFVARDEMLGSLLDIIA